MSDADTIVVDTARRIFNDLGDPQTINNAGDTGWQAPLWTALEESGLTQAWTPEDCGGAGAGIDDGFAVLRVAGEFAAPLPLAETLLAGWLLSQGGLTAPPGAMTVAPVRARDRLRLGDDGTLSGTARAVPFARDAEHIAVLASRGADVVIALVNRAACAVSAGENMAGEAQDAVNFDGVAPLALADAPDGIDDDALLRMGAASRAMQIAGALQAILDLSIAYAKERVAFERPIGKFQAVQHNLARLAGETAAAIAAAGSAADSIRRNGPSGAQVFLDVAAAKIRVGEAAGEGAAIAHQAHGAIGFTEEHILHRYTMRLWSWRDDFGGESEWALRLGEAVAANGADALWPMVTAQ